MKRVATAVFLHLLFWTCLPDLAQAIEMPAGVAGQLELINQQKESGNYAEAQKMYEALLEDSALSEEQLSEIRAGYEALNMNLLFSRFEMPESRWYTVVSGDTLYEIAKKNNTTIGLIKRSNGLSRDTIYPDMKLKVVPGTFAIAIDKSDNVLKLYLNDKLMRRYSVATGKDNSTPVGEFKITDRLVDPTWYKAGAIVPPDSPDNILGTRWLGFDYPGYGIHGTTQPESLGQQASAGCIRMLNAEVEELFDIIPSGTKVVIKD